MYCKSNIKSQNVTSVIKSWPCTWYKWQWFLLRTLISLTEYGHFYFKDIRYRILTKFYIRCCAQKRKKVDLCPIQYHVYNFLSFLCNLFSSFFFIWSRRWCKWFFFYHRCFFMNCSVISFFFFIFTFGPILDAVILPALCENNVGLAACTLVSYSITIALSLSPILGNLQVFQMMPASDRMII